VGYPFICSSSFVIIQNGKQYDTVELETFYGSSQCEYVYVPSVFRLNQWSHYTNLADLNQPFTLIYEGVFNTYWFSIPATGPALVGYPIFDLDIVDLIEPTNTENVYHFTEKLFDPYGTAHITVSTVKTGTAKVDIYAKCTYPNGRSYWLYFDKEIDTCEEWGCFYWQEKETWLKFHNTPEPEWTNLIFDELTDYALIHPALWFDKRKKAEWNLPNGVYTWEVYILPHGTEVTTEEDVKNNAVQIDSAVLTLIAIPGDCNDDGNVTIDEVQKCINCFLGIENDCCDKCDVNSNDQVTIDEVQKVINAFLGIV